MTVRVLIADDQRMVREGFRALLQADPGIEVVGLAADGAAAVEAALDAAAPSRPDVVLMDIRMPVLDGLAATRRILAGPAPVPRVLMLTTFDLDDYVYDALRSGASGFLLKDARPAELVAAVHTVAAGDALLAPAVTRRLIEEFVRSRPPVGADADQPLTARETEVLVLIARGLSNAEIGAALVVAEETVKTHVGRIFGKLGVRDRAQAVVHAYESGLVTPSGH